MLVAVRLLRVLLLGYYICYYAMTMRESLLRNGRRLDGADFEDRIFNDGEAEIILIDIDRRDRTAAEYYKQREACLGEIKNSQGSTNKV